MRHGHTIAKRMFRRFYYIGAALVIALAVGSFVIPVSVGVRGELSRKIDQLASAIIAQKRILLETIVVEKIGDIEAIRRRLESQSPPLTAEDFDSRFRWEVREAIHGARLPDDGYIWINEIIDYEGGDNYAIRFAHPNLVDTEGDYLSTHTTDIAGNLPYLEELEGIRHSGEIYFDYYFRKMGSEQISHKLSFAKLYEPYNWVVATGVYLDDVDMLIEAETAAMIASTSRTFRDGVIVFLIGIVLLVVVTILFETHIGLLIDSYVDTERLIGMQLRDEKLKLEESNRQKDRLFTVIAHDLRNPVHALSAGIRFLDESSRGRLDDLGCAIMDELTSGATSLAELLDRLLEWSRSQQGSLAFNPKELDPSSALREVRGSLLPLATRKGVALNLGPETGSVIYADEEMLQTIVRNLVGNAIKFTRPGGSVTVSSRDVADGVEISVTDTGIGIEQHTLERLFAVDSGYRTPGTDGEKGSGFGLDLCKEFVRRHDGRLTVESRVGEGSSFRFVLPLPNGRSAG